jgi:hypothetical protein
MRVLLVQPEDSPRTGPWSRERWDLILDVGNSSAFSAEAWAQQYGCPVLRANSFQETVADVKRVRHMFSVGRGWLIDEEGIDWWDLTSLLLEAAALAVLPLRRISAEISPASELWTTRSGERARLFAVMLGRTLRTFGASRLARATVRALHYAGLTRRFSAPQMKEIFLDKYDSGYRWRARFARPRQSHIEPVILVPSAYGNVSRMAAAYASLLPEQTFLTVATRPSGRQFVPPPNVHLRNLADYASGSAALSEIKPLQERWTKLQADLCLSPDWRVISEAGGLDPIPGWIRDGLSVRDAWRKLLAREPVCGVLCGDDSNLYTLLPVLLAGRSNLPTVDFHHGAIDGRYLIKDLPCDVYLAKSEMERDYLLRVCSLPAERVVIGSPSAANFRAASQLEPQVGASAIFFSEPYEVAGMRAEEVYRELLPLLCRLARESNRGVILKLHPFESRTQRSRLLRDILTTEDRALVRIVDGPLTKDLMAQAWFGITVESTTVMDCVQNGVQCFLCGWLKLSPYGYVEQYARFGLGEVLQDAQQIETIPKRLQDFHNAPKAIQSAEADPAMLRRWLTSALTARDAENPVS